MQIEVRECLISFSAESFVFQFAIRNYEDKGLQNSNFTCCFVWVWNLISHTEEGTKDEVFWEQGAEKDIWA
jgi:hypothetical protein